MAAFWASVRVSAGRPFSAGDVPVVAAVVGVAFGAVTALQVFEREGFVAAGGAAVEDEPFHFFHREDFFLFHFKIVLEVIPPSWHTALNSECSQNSCNHGCNDFPDLCDFGPIYFDHFCKTDLKLCFSKRSRECRARTWRCVLLDEMRISCFAIADPPGHSMLA